MQTSPLFALLFTKHKNRSHYFSSYLFQFVLKLYALYKEFVLHLPEYLVILSRFSSQPCTHLNLDLRLHRDEASAGCHNQA